MHVIFFRVALFCVLISASVFPQNTLVGLGTTADFGCSKFREDPIIKKQPNKLIKSSKALGGISYVNDRYGNILLYSDGKTLWDGHGNIIGSGYDGIVGARAQAVVLAKNMKREGIYYMFYISRDPETSLSSVNYVVYNEKSGYYKSDPIPIVTSKDVGAFLGLTAVNIGHETHIAFIDFSNNELRGAVIDHENDDLIQRYVLGILPESHYIDYAHLKFSPSGNFLSVITETASSSTLQVFRYHSRKRPQEIFRSDLELEQPYKYAEFSADENYLFSLIEDKKRNSKYFLARYDLSKLSSDLVHSKKIIELPLRYKKQNVFFKNLVSGGLQLTYNGDIYLYFKDKEYVVALNPEVKFNSEAFSLIGGISTKMLNYAPSLESSMFKIPFLVNCLPEDSKRNFVFNLREVLPIYFSDFNWLGADIAAVKRVKFYKNQERTVGVSNPTYYVPEKKNELIYLSFEDDLGNCYTNPRVALKRSYFSKPSRIRINSNEGVGYIDLSAPYKKEKKDFFVDKGIKFKNTVYGQKTLEFYEFYDSVKIEIPHLYEVKRNVSQIYAEVEGVYGCKRMDTLQLFYSSYASIQESVDKKLKEKLDMMSLSLEQNRVYSEDILNQFSKLVVQISLSSKSLNDKYKSVVEVILDQAIYELLSTLKNKAMPGLDKKISLIIEKSLIKLKQISNPDNDLKPTFSLENRLLNLVAIIEGRKDTREKILQDLDLVELNSVQKREVLNEKEKLLASNRELFGKHIQEGGIMAHYYEPLLEDHAAVLVAADFNKAIFGNNFVQKIEKSKRNSKSEADDPGSLMKDSIAAVAQYLNFISVNESEKNRVKLLRKNIKIQNIINESSYDQKGISVLRKSSPRIPRKIWLGPISHVKEEEYSEMIPLSKAKRTSAPMLQLKQITEPALRTPTSTPVFTEKSQTPITEISIKSEKSVEKSRVESISHDPRIIESPMPNPDLMPQSYDFGDIMDDERDRSQKILDSSGRWSHKGKTIRSGIPPYIKLVPSQIIEPDLNREKQRKWQENFREHIYQELSK